MKTRMPESGADNLLHARAHREVIRSFGRFPYRNAALSRRHHRREAAFLEWRGYAAVLREFARPPPPENAARVARPADASWRWRPIG